MEVLTRMKKQFSTLIIFFTFVLGQGSQSIPDPPKGYANMTFLKWSIKWGWLERVNLNPEIPDSIEVIRDIIYKETPQRDLKLDLYQNRYLSQNAPVIIFIHGGSWTKGDKNDYLVYCLSYAQRGYVTASLSYRFSQESLFPSAIEDVICGIKWIKQNGDKYGIDSSRVALVGGSAGGHLAILAAYTSDEFVFETDCHNYETSATVQAVVNIYGPSDLTTDYAISVPATQKFIGGQFHEMPEVYKKASPIQYVSPSDPPTLILHGTLDKIVPVTQSDSLRNKLITVGVPSEYHRLEGWPHTMDAAVPVNNYTQAVMNQFFKTWLKGESH